MTPEKKVFFDRFGRGGGIVIDGEQIPTSKFWAVFFRIFVQMRIVLKGRHNLKKKTRKNWNLEALNQKNLKGTN